MHHRSVARTKDWKVIIYTWCLMSTETIGLIRDGEKVGKGVWKWGQREIIHLSLHCHHQNDFCVNTGSVERHFNVSVGSDGQSHKTVSTDHNLLEEKGEPKRYRTLCSMQRLGLYSVLN